MARYYVSTSGSDSNSGLTELLPWATVSKANATAVAGDTVQYKAADTWLQSILNPANSGTAALPITVTSYGAGAKPIIQWLYDVPGWTVSGNWTNAGGNIWYLTGVTVGYFHRIFLNGTVYLEAASAAAVTSTLRYFSDAGGTNRFSVYATANPATFYTSMQVPSATLKNGGKIADGPCTLSKDWLNIQNIDFRGGWAAINVNGCNHVDIAACTLGYHSLYGSDTGLTANTYVDVHHCTGDPGVTPMSLTHPDQLGGDFIRTWEGSLLNSNIYSNTPFNWPHSGISISGTGFNAMRFIRVYDNDISCPDVNYGRGFDVTGTSEDSVRDNQFYRNYVHDTHTPCQINGNHNLIYRNVIDTVTAGVADGYHYGVVMHSATGKITHHNTFAHNVVYNTANSSFWIGAAAGSPTTYSNEISNNIFMNWGASEKGIISNNEAGLLDNIFRNNVLYKSGDTSPVTWKGTTMTTATFNSTVVGASGNLTGDPLFTDAPNGNFTLLASGGTGADEIIGYTAGASLTGNVAGFSYGHKNTSVTPAGSGARLLKELSGEVRVTSGSPFIRLAIFRASDNALIAQGTAKVAVVGATHTWQGHLTQASITPNPASLVGGTAYKIEVAHQSTVEHKNGTVTNGDSGIVFNDYGDAGFPSTFPSGSDSTSMPNIRAVLEGLPTTSITIDGGVVLPGINDGYSGTAPDIGAFEYVPVTQTTAAWVSGDRIRETSTTTGLSDLTLLGAVSLFRPFSTIAANGDLVEYAIVHQTLAEMEVGLGRWTTGGILQRLTVSESSNANGLVNFSSGTKDVFCTFPAAHGILSPVTRRQTSSQLLPPGSSTYVIGRYEVSLGTRLEISSAATLEIG